MLLSMAEVSACGFSSAANPLRSILRLPGVIVMTPPVVVAVGGGVAACRGVLVVVAESVCVAAFLVLWGRCGLGAGIGAEAGSED